VAKRAKFKPPKVMDPPSLVEIEWIDAVSEVESETLASKAGGLAAVPTAGYHVRTVNHSEHGAFVVIAREWYHDEDELTNVRDTTTIPTGWIKTWAVVTAKVTLWPQKSEEFTTSTSTTTGNRTKRRARSGSTTSEPAQSAGASQSAFAPESQPS